MDHEHDQCLVVSVSDVCLARMLKIKHRLLLAFSSNLTNDCCQRNEEKKGGNIIETQDERVVLRMERSIDGDYRLTGPLTHDLVNKLAVILGHCDLLGEHLRAGSPSGNRVGAIREIAQGMAKELNEYQCKLAQCARSVEVEKRRVHRLDELPSTS